jgi:hypothetical protein
MCDFFGAPKLKPALDLSDTRISATHNLILSIVRLETPLINFHAHCTRAEPGSHKALLKEQKHEELFRGLDVAFFTALIEIEAVLNVVKLGTTIVQAEKFIVGGFGPIVANGILDTLRGKVLQILDQSDPSRRRRVPLRIDPEDNDEDRDDPAVQCFSSLGKRLVTRCICEMERRFCSEYDHVDDSMEFPDLSNPSAHFSEHDELAIFLDLRLTMSPMVSLKNVKAAVNKLRSTYVEFACNAEHDPTRSASERSSLSTAAATGSTASASQGQEEDNAGSLVVNQSSFLTGLLHGKVAWDDETTTSDGTRESEREQLIRKHERLFDTTVWSEWRKLAKIVLQKSIAAVTRTSARDMHQPESCICSELWKLMQYDVCGEYRAAELQKDKYGYMPALAYCIVGGCLSESYCERVLSQANMILTKDNTRLGIDTVRKLVILRMNAKFLRWAKCRSGVSVLDAQIPARHNMDAATSSSRSSSPGRDDDIVSQYSLHDSVPLLPIPEIFEGVPRAGDKGGMTVGPPSTVTGGWQ